MSDDRDSKKQPSPSADAPGKKGRPVPWGKDTLQEAAHAEAQEAAGKARAQSTTMDDASSDTASDPAGRAPSPSIEFDINDVPIDRRGPLTGQVLEQRYLIKEKLGVGGMGVVYRAEHRLMRKEMAVKVLLPEYGSFEGIQKRFHREAQSSSRLDHPGIIHINDFGETEDGLLFIAMELLDGRSLTEVIRDEAPLSLERCTRIILQLALALDHAHGQGVVHRDLKPDNVMLGEFGETVVLDWGLAKAQGKKDRRMEVLVEEMEQLRKSSGSETVMGAPMGTPSYMPPEQARGELDAIDERSDVYSLGAILYEILTGRPPHVGTSALDVLHKVEAEEIKSPDRLEPDAPPELAAICMHALRRERAQRYESAKELADDVRRFQVGGLVRAHTYTAWELWRRWLRRHRTALAVVGTMLTLAAGVWWYRGFAEERTRSRAERQRRTQVLAEVEKILADVAQGTKQKNWLDIYSFKLISLKEPLVERRLIRALGHAKVAVRRLVARSLGGMKSRRAVPALCARLGDRVESSETVVIAVINALGIIGDSRAFEAVSKARWRAGQYKFVWKNTELAFHMIPMPPLPRTGVTPNRLVDRGRDMVNLRAPKGALALYNRALALDPKLVRAYVNRAVVKNQLKDRAGALEDYNRAIALDPTEMYAYHNRAVIRRYQGDYAGALADLNRVVASEKDRAVGLRTRAGLYRHLGKTDLALQDFQASLKLQPRHANAHYMLAFLWRDKGDVDRAFASLNRALKFQPRHCKALTVRAAIRQYRGDLAGALVDADKAVAVDPEYLYSYTRRGQILLARGRTAAAKADFDKAVQLKESHGWRWAARGIFYHAILGQYDRAAADLAEAHRRGRAKRSVWGFVYRVLHVAVLLRQGKAPLARDLLRQTKLDQPPGYQSRTILYLRGKLEHTAILGDEPPTPRQLSYLVFLRGLKAELDGDPATARKAYGEVVVTLRWSNLWYALAEHTLKKLGPGEPDPDKADPLKPKPKPKPKP